MEARMVFKIKNDPIGRFHKVGKLELNWIETNIAPPSSGFDYFAEPPSIDFKLDSNNVDITPIQIGPDDFNFHISDIVKNIAVQAIEQNQEKIETWLGVL